MRAAGVVYSRSCSLNVEEQLHALNPNADGLIRAHERLAIDADVIDRPGWDDRCLDVAGRWPSPQGFVAPW